MRYKFIELVGYIGFYNGMGLNQINIDFTKCRYNKILIRGKNGSGKSTLLNAINPNPDGNECFMPGIEARKTICIIDTNTEYLIRYIHPVNKHGERITTKGYISRIVDGKSIELNPSGNISSCKDILYEEFNLDSSYVSLSKISSENRGIVDSKPAERKKLLSNVINALETYNGIYKNISKKTAVYKSNLNSLIYKIDSIGSVDNLISQVRSINTQLDSLNKTKDGIIETIAAIKIKIADYNQILVDNNYDDTVAEMRSLYKEIKVLDNQIQETLSTYRIKSIDDIDKFLQYIDNAIVKLKSDIEHYKSLIPNMLSERELDVRELQEKNMKLSTLQSEYNYTDLKVGMEQCAERIKSCEEVLSSIGGNVMNITRIEYDEAMEAFDYLLKESKEIFVHFHGSDVKFAIDHFGEIDGLVKQAKELQKRNTALLLEKGKLNKRSELFKAKRQLASILVDRPEDCTNDKCSYIKKALLADKNYPQEEYDKVLARLDEVEQEMTDNFNKIHNSELYFYIKCRLIQINKFLDSKIKYMLNLPIRRDFRDTFIERLGNMDPFNDIEEMTKYVDCANFIDEYNSAKKQYEIYQMEYKVYESKNELVDSIINDIEDLNKKTTYLDDQIESNTKSINEASSKLVELEEAYSKVKSLADKINISYKPSKEKYKELEGIKNALDDNAKIIESLNDDLNKSNMTLGEITNDIKRLTNEKENCAHRIKLLEEYNKDLEVYKSKYTKLDKIRFYASPSTGIQTLFMELYMNKIIITANDLLSMLFGGEFSLRPFIVNEAEFRIPCIGDGLMHDDISSMSTAQKSMISMILSFAILYQSSTKYNIISIDEIDGYLDTNNRAYFTSLLDRLMNMLQCEQCFIISHNDELNTSSADLILLKNDINYSYQGNVIWKY